MPEYDETRAECVVLTFKDGLLSPVAHDLRLLVTRFTVEVDETSVSARFDAASLVVDTPMKDGAPSPGALSAADKAKIAAQIREDVLHTAKFPEVLFRSRSLSQRADGGWDFSGDLALHGVTKWIAAHTRLVEGRQELELTLHQPDFDITPYRALFGTLKVQPGVKVRLRL